MSSGGNDAMANNPASPRLRRLVSTVTRRDNPRATTTVSRHVAAAPEEVFAAATDAWQFPLWVIGATHMRDVDGDWPAIGTRAHHQVGPWPLAVSDTTLVRAIEPDRRIALDARAWPVGVARVEIDVEPEGDGTLITMAEWPVRGLGRWLDGPPLRALLRARNRESLVRLAAIAERGSAEQHDRK